MNLELNPTYTGNYQKVLEYPIKGMVDGYGNETARLMRLIMVGWDEKEVRESKLDGLG